MLIGLPPARGRRAILIAIVTALIGCGGGAQMRRIDAAAGAGGEAQMRQIDAATDAHADAPQVPAADGSTGERPGEAGTIVVGQPCSAANRCASGFCFDGVCCKTDCSSTCETCAAAGSVGTCLPADVGTDPRLDCDDQGPASCEHDGFCDGAGACENYPAGVGCRPGTCTGSTLTFAGRCDGLGTCLTPSSQTCAPFSCAATSQCQTTCAADADCAAGNTCTNGSCGQSPIGASCAADTDCNSAFCAQGICCATACTGNCRSCAIAGNAGSCTSVPAGQDPLAQCTPSTTSVCGTDGLCDGAGNCRLAVAGTVCGTDACAAGTETPAGRCDGVGDCVAGTTEACSPYLCGAGGDCSTTCASSADCLAPNVCTAGVCASGCAGVYCDNFETDTVGAMAAGWTREGGSDGDFQVIADATKAFAQNHALSSTFRLCYASGATGAPWSGATSVTAQVKVLSLGSSGTTGAFVCLRYTGGSAGDYDCLVLEPGVGAQILVRRAGAVASGPVWTATIAVGTAYVVKLSVNAAGALSASVGGALLGTTTPATAVANGTVAVATESTEAAFDNLVVTQP
jgi:hypothetical protein